MVEFAFKAAPQLSRHMLVYEDTWETDLLKRSLAAVDDRPSNAFIEAHPDSLATFTPEGLRHVLPFYIRYALEQPDTEWGGDSWRQPFVSLSPETPDNEYWQKRLATFAPMQKKAICEYIRAPGEQEARSRVLRRRPHKGRVVVVLFLVRP
jgi:hypothetical protein